MKWLYHWHLAGANTLKHTYIPSTFARLLPNNLLLASHSVVFELQLQWTNSGDNWKGCRKGEIKALDWSGESEEKRARCALEAVNWIVQRNIAVAVVISFRLLLKKTCDDCGIFWIITGNMPNRRRDDFKVERIDKNFSNRD